MKKISLGQDGSKFSAVGFGAMSFVDFYGPVDEELPTIKFAFASVVSIDNIKQGQIVGTLGQSGRATGPHLDIRLNWFDVKLDPNTILKMK